ncbi:MAG: GTP cyclohydrolase FolE2 [Pseudomonadota bacterium]
MTARSKPISLETAIPDVQGYADDRHIEINRVGIRDIRHPVSVVDRSGDVQHTVARFSMTVRLPEDRKGTHMSRFTQLLNEHNDTAHSVKNFEGLFEEMNTRLDSAAGTIEMTFPYFVRKAAPASGVTGVMDYEVTLRSDVRVERNTETHIKVAVPVTTLCPCSKEISEYGAHNQRSHITIDACISEPVWIEELIDIAEREGSSELFSQLKRADEKIVTERAYDNPKFVEDLIRDVAKHLNKDERIRSYVLEVENFESIHNHSAYAMIARDKSAPEG